MKITKENYSVYSIVILIFGWLYFFVISYLNGIDFASQFTNGILPHVARRGIYDTIWFQLIAIGFGTISLYFSYKSKPHVKRKLLILISLLLIIISIIFFPSLIFEYLI